MVYNPENYDSNSTIETDLILGAWAQVHGLAVSKEFTEDNDRFIQIIDNAGDSYGVWIGPPEEGKNVNIVVAENAINGLRVPDQTARTESFSTTVEELQPALNSVYRLVETWMSERGHMRSAPVI